MLYDCWIRRWFFLFKPTLLHPVPSFVYITLCPVCQTMKSALLGYPLSENNNHEGKIDHYNPCSILDGAQIGWLRACIAGDFWFLSSVRGPIIWITRTWSLHLGGVCLCRFLLLGISDNISVAAPSAFGFPVWFMSFQKISLVDWIFFFFFA